jgi:hypothetical protein
MSASDSGWAGRIGTENCGVSSDDNSPRGVKRSVMIPSTGSRTGTTTPPPCGHRDRCNVGPSLGPSMRCTAHNIRSGNSWRNVSTIAVGSAGGRWQSSATGSHAQGPDNSWPGGHSARNVLRAAEQSRTEYSAAAPTAARSPGGTGQGPFCGTAAVGHSAIDAPPEILGLTASAALTPGFSTR